jgi:transposase
VPLVATARITTKKKTLHASERDTPRVQQARRDWRKVVGEIDLRRLRFVDESGVNVAMTRLFGRAPRGERVVGSVPQNYGSNLTILASLGVSGLDALMTIEGATDGEVFKAYVEQVLCPRLVRCDVVVVDNLGAHKVAGVREAIERCGAKLIYLPPYSPDLSPIEKCWSKIKAFIRAVGARTYEALEEVIKQAIATVTESDALAWFIHCGYLVN